MFITFEGPECAGKSTQIRMLAEVLERDHDVVMVREPGGTHVGEEIRRLVKHVYGEDAPSIVTELLLFGASRAQLVDKVIQPALDAGAYVLCDRFLDSTTVYQGYARGICLDTITDVHRLSVRNCMPDLTVLMDLGIEEMSRRHVDRGGTDRFEEEADAFHRSVIDGYRTLATGDDRFFVVDATLDRETIHDMIVDRVISKNDIRELC